MSLRYILILPSHLRLGFPTAVLNTRIRKILYNNPLGTKNVSQRNTNHAEVPAHYISSTIKSGANLVVLVHTTSEQYLVELPGTSSIEPFLRGQY
jgi:hypothetical protein